VCEDEPIQVNPLGVHVPDPDITEVVVVIGSDR